MKTLLLKSLLFGILAISFSCNSNDEGMTVNDFKGYYKIKSISSSLQIDLNNDGLKSNDYLQEIKSNYISYNGEIINYGYDNEVRPNFAEARPTKSQPNDTQFLDIRFPIQRIDSIYLGNDDYAKMNMEYWRMTTGFIYTLSENNIFIESDPFNQFEYYNISSFTINRLSEIEFEISFDFNIYDFTENEWIETNLKATYEKAEE